MGLSWACASKTASEGLPMELIPLNNKSDFGRYIKMDAAGTFSYQVHMSRSFYWWYWYQAIEIYSHRKFTYESNRLIVLAGLAAKFPSSEDEFLYGLWGENEENTTDVSLASPRPLRSWACRPDKVITYAEREREGIGLECNYATIL